MLKKPSVRTLIDSEHVKGCENLHKSAPQYFAIIFDHSERNSARKKLF